VKRRGDLAARVPATVGVRRQVLITGPLLSDNGMRQLSGYRPTKPDVAVFVSGVTSMGLGERADHRPQFGSSIYTWGASSPSSSPR